MIPGREELGDIPPGLARKRLVLLTRYPVPGKTKTRLIPVLGAERAASLQRRLTLRAVRAAEAFCSLHHVDLEIQFAGDRREALEHWIGDRFRFCAQAQGDLGDRMRSAFGKSFQEGLEATVLIGADCPELTADVLEQAFARLAESDVVFGPAADGGYYLIGMKKSFSGLFCDVAWGTDTVLAHSLEIVKKAGLRYSLLHPLRDIDRPEDLPFCEQIFGQEDADLIQVSVIIPTLNEAAQISRTVEAARKGDPMEIIVVDSGRDGTDEQAREAGATVLRSRPGRARQMNAGASKATGNLLLFLHADTLLPPNYKSAAAGALSDASVSAGAFRLAIGMDFPGRKFVEWSANIRSSWFQLPYGDQALFVRRSTFEQVGGFAELPILEDFELVRRLRRRGKVITLKEAAVTSGRRWQQLGVLRATWINQWIILGYHLGWPIDRLAAVYKMRRKINSNGQAEPGLVVGSAAVTASADKKPLDLRRQPQPDRQH